MFEIGYLHKLIRDIPKPVIAAVNGVAVGGGHVLHVLCDVSHRQRDRPLRAGRSRGSAPSTPASARRTSPVSWGRRRPARSGSGAGMYYAEEALAMGLVNKVVPGDQLLKEAKAGPPRWPRRARPRSASSSSPSTPTPTTRPAFSNMAMTALDLFARLARRAWRAPRPSPRSASPTSTSTSTGTEPVERYADALRDSTTTRRPSAQEVAPVRDQDAGPALPVRRQGRASSGASWRSTWRGWA